MVLENLKDSCLPCQNGTVKNLQTHWWCKGTGEPLTELTPSPSGTPPVPPVPSGENEGAEMSEIESVPPRYVYLHVPLPKTQILNHVEYAKDCKWIQDIIPDLLTDEEATTG